MQNVLLPAVVKQESGGNPNALSPKGAAGMFQIMPDTARDPGFGVQPLQGWDGMDPRTAPQAEQERFANDYLNAMQRQHGGNPALALAAYNAGPGAVQQYGGIPPFKETQNYVRNILPNGVQMASNTDWRSRAAPVNVAPTQQAPVSDWKSRATTPTAAPTDWRTRATPIQQGTNMGGTTAAVQGFNSAVPFGERMAAGLAAGGAYAYNKVAGLDGEGNSLGELYNEARQNQQATEDANPGAYMGGAVAGIAATLPVVSSKVLTGTKATTGARGAINAVPQMLTSVGNYVRGGQVAAGAGTAAKAANLAGKAVRSASVAAPAGALYSYGASKNDLDSPEAAADAEFGAKLAAGLGAAVPVVGATVGALTKTNVAKEVGDLAKRAIDDFGIKLSVDQIAPSKVRDAVQKVSQSIPGSGVDAFQQGQRSQWMRAVAKEIGQDSDTLGPEVITKFLDDASTKFEAVVKHADIKFNTKSFDAISKIAKEAKDNITKDYSDLVVGKAENLANQLFKARNVPSGVEYTAKQLNGKKLASIRSQLIKDLPKVAGDARQYVSELVDVIDDIAEKNLAKADIEQLAVARREWRNFRTLEPLLEKSTDGTINPTQLMQRVASSKYIKASRKKLGEDNLVDLAKIGKQFLGVKGGSDTVPKMIIAGGAGGIPIALMTNPLLAVQGAAAAGVGAAANRGYQKFVNQSQKNVGKVIKGVPSSTKSVPIADMLAAGATQRITGQ